MIDAGQAKQRVPSDPVFSPAKYSVFYDVNGNGLIDVIDAGQIKQRTGLRLPSPPSAPAMVPIADAARATFPDRRIADEVFNPPPEA